MSILNLLRTGGGMPLFCMAEAGDAGGAGGAAPAVKPPSGGAKPAPATTPPAAAAPEKKTFLEDDAEGAEGEEDTPKKDSEAADDWRKRVAGEDDKFYKRLQRYSSEADLGKKLTELEKQISKIPPSLGKDASEEEIAAYRKKVGIPEKPEGYEKSLRLPEGTVIGEADKPLIGDFLKTAHAKNWSQEAVNDAVSWYYGTQKQQEALLNEWEKKALAETRAELHEEWGPDYSSNRGMISAWLERQDGGVGEMLAGARGPDGLMLTNSAPFAKWLAAHIRETEPSATILQNAAETGVSVDDRIRSIQDVIANNPKKYDAKMQAELAKLSTIKRRAAG